MEQLSILKAKDLHNPYWEQVQGYHEDWDYMVGKRRRLCKKYAWAIPNPASLDFIAEHTKDTGIIEIGAGNGYWASLLTQLGVLPYTAFDMAPPHRIHNDWMMVGQKYYDVRIGGTEEVVNYPERTLMLCWPPHNTDMAYDALTAYKGNRFVYIGEGEGGCTGTTEFFELLGREWNMVAAHPIAQWDAIHDLIEVYERTA